MEEEKDIVIEPIRKIYESQSTQKISTAVLQESFSGSKWNRFLQALGLRPKKPARVFVIWEGKDSDDFVIKSGELVGDFSKVANVKNVYRSKKNGK